MAVLVHMAGADAGRLMLIGFAGLLTSRLLGDVWTLATARLQSKRIALVRLGIGRIIAEGVVGGALVELRALPGLPLVTWYTVQAPLARLRIWLGTALSAALQVALGGWLLGSSSTFTMGLTILGATAWRILSTLRGPLGTGWILLVAPFRPSALPLSSAANLRAAGAVLTGRIDDLRAAVPDLTSEDRPELDLAVLALAEGRYEEAEQHGRTALAAAGPSSVTADYNLAISAAIVGAVDSGELSPDLGAERLTAALGAFKEPADVVLCGVPAAVDFARFEGRLDDAVAIARRQHGTQTSRFWRAEGACSLAAALGAVGRFTEARSALDDAQRFCPGLARIGHVERLVDRWEAGVGAQSEAVGG
ncbi:hypothetical protein ACWGB8_08770 [Kitasatospora sp. NPDC054939]